MRPLHANECHLYEVTATAEHEGGTAFEADGGADSYNNRLRGVRSYGPFDAGLVVGRTAPVAGLYLDGGLSFGGARNVGVLLHDASGCFLENGEILKCGRGLVMAPGTGQFVVAVHGGAGVQVDSCKEEGLVIADAGGYVSSVLLGGGLWCCSNGQAGHPGLVF